MLRLAWPSYTNAAIFLFHATTRVFFAGFPAWRQQGDALDFANKTFNPFVALYVLLLTLVLIWLFGRINRRLNRHMARSQ